MPVPNRSSLLAAVLITSACGELADPVGSRQANVGSTDEYDVIDLGQFGGGPTQAYLINDAGVVGGRYPGGTFLWTKQGGFRDAGRLDGRPFSALSMSNQGDLVGTVTGPTIGDIAPYLLTRDGEFIRLLAGNENGRGWGINEKRQVSGVKLSTPTSRSSAFIWEKGNITLVGPPAELGHGATSGAGINQHGQITGFVVYRNANEPCCRHQPLFYDPSSGSHALPGLGGWSSVGIAINDDGVVVGTGEIRPPNPNEGRVGLPTNNPGTVEIHAWRWSASAGMRDLGTLGGKHSVAWAVDQHGNAYGWAMNALGQQRAVKWTSDGRIIELGTLGGTFSITGSANRRGAVAGQAATLTGARNAVLYIPR